MATGAWTPRWLRTAYTNALGEQKTLHLKASQSSTGEVLWEWQGLLGCFLSKGRIKVGDEISRIRHAFSLFLSEVDMEYAQCSKDSIRSLLATVPKGGQIQDHPAIHDGHVSDEFTLSTTGLCMLCLYWANHRHVKHEKRSGILLLAAFIAHMVGTRGLHSLPWQEALAADSNRCTIRHAAASSCKHLQHASWPENLGTDEGLGITVVEKLLWLYGIATECPSGKAMFRRVLEHLCTVINTNMEEKTEGDASKQPKVTVQGNLKRKRVDEDQKRYRMTTMVQKGMASSSSSAVRADPDNQHRSLASQWCKQHVSRSLASMWSFFHDQVVRGVHSIASDATRLGNPAEDTVAFAYWSRQWDAGQWLSVQVKQLSFPSKCQ